MKDGFIDISAALQSCARGAKNAVAVSGGPDSMALCHALSHSGLCDEVHILSVDHGLRPEARNEAEQVGRWVKDWPSCVHTILVRDVDKAIDSRIQEDARHDRYALMADYCSAHTINQLYVAHHQDDQAETFLFRLAKGSGLDGLSAMQTAYELDCGLSIIRPFLNIPKAMLMEYCSANDVPYLQDPSNKDEQYARVRLRKSYQVLAEEGLTAKRLAVTAARLSRAREALDYYADKVLLNNVSERTDTRLTLAYQKLKDEPTEIRLRVLLSVIDEFGNAGQYGPRMEKVESLQKRLFEADSYKKSALGGCLFDISADRCLLIIEKEV